MQQNSIDVLNSVHFLYPKESNVERLVSHKAFVPFDELVCTFLNECSKELLSDKQAKTFPDVVTFAFFCRKANIEKLKESYKDRLNGRLGRGITLHIAPSNVPINFAYTLVAGLLAGNRCIVRASSKDFAQTEIICKVLDKIAERDEFFDLKNILAVVMFDHSTEIMNALSSLCDVRVVWGGDKTIAEIRQSPMKPRATEITFADRYSFAVFDAEYVGAQGDEDLKKIAQSFFNDTYLYDQNACSSPRFIVWHGKKEQCSIAKEKFWSAVHENVSSKYNLPPILAVDKLTTQYKCAVELESVKIEQSVDNVITRIAINSIPQNIVEYMCAGGFYLEYETDNIDDIVPVVNNKFQTLSYLGVNPVELLTLVIQQGLSGIDRIVPVGKTADFGFIWDGYDLIECMSRVIYV
ncbi:Acyl-CoA reductase (LuxC) [Fibrobacter sp. UWH9]|uniref:acyl-CoA reductase n=1 Tax=Fibrobacter sp. UWH9 TaxID=1896213 RepID=UPI00090F4A70|nr:acyl-CoA reductase [Fibrobacter sp. UWH9]SHG33077.1 Acyl-CoA reductase (LuxC) [Fibrobacter sp. UWH9]